MWVLKKKRVVKIRVFFSCRERERSIWVLKKKSVVKIRVFFSWRERDRDKHVRFEE
jgi:RNA-binding protein YhbY